MHLPSYEALCFESCRWNPYGHSNQSLQCKSTPELLNTMVIKEDHFSPIPLRWVAWDKSKRVKKKGWIVYFRLKRRGFINLIEIEHILSNDSWKTWPWSLFWETGDCLAISSRPSANTWMLDLPNMGPSKGWNIILVLHGNFHWTLRLHLSKKVHNTQD